MTKKDYIVIAMALKDLRQYVHKAFDEASRPALQEYERQLIIRLGQYFLGDNPRYNHKKFEDFINK